MANPFSISNYAIKIVKILEENLNEGLVSDLSQTAIGRILGLGRLKVKGFIDELEDLKIVKVVRSWGTFNCYELSEDYKKVVSGLDK